MLVTPNFNDVKDSITAGTYTARIVSATMDEWRTGTKYVNWRLETFNEDEAKNNGRSIFYKTPIEGGGAFRLADFYRAAMKATPTAEGFDTDDLMGKEVQLVVADGVNQAGEPTGYPEVKAVRTI